VKQSNIDKYYAGKLEYINKFIFSDLRGKDFRGKNLENSDFSWSVCGKSKLSFAIISVIVSVLAVLSGLLSGAFAASGTLLAQSLAENFIGKSYFFIYFAVLIIPIFLFYFIFYRGQLGGVLVVLFIIMAALLIVAGAWAVQAIMAADLASLAARAIESAILGKQMERNYSDFSGVISIALGVTIVGVGALFVNGGAICAGVTAGLGTRAVMLVGAVIGTRIGFFVAEFKQIELSFFGSFWIFLLVIFLIPAYISRRIQKEAPEFLVFRRFGLLIACLGGTDFRSTLLKGANFSNAKLKNCRFGSLQTNNPKEKTSILPHLHRTNFRKAEGLKFAWPGDTILAEPKVRELLVTGKVEPNTSYAGLNLKGAYLDAADLSNADFTESDLSGATLRNANLQNANLTKVQALGVDFSGADFTGACLESWNIDSTTVLEGSHAKYVYLRNGQQERRPSSGEFGEGEFAKLFQEVLDTVDLIFKNGIDWQAFQESFNDLREKVQVETEEGEDAEVEVKEILNKGDGVFVVKIAVPKRFDKAEVHAAFKSDYDQKALEMKEQYEERLLLKDETISHLRQHNIDLKEIIKDQSRIQEERAKAKSDIHVSVQAEAKSMGDETRTMNIGGNVVSSTLNLGEISGQVTTTLQQLPQSANPAAPSLRDKLAELQTALETGEPEALDDDEKAQALQQVEAIAKAEMDGNQAKGKKKAQRSLGWLQSFAQSLPTATKAAQEMNRLLPEISKWFGLG
jgi:uncharacterized protein YjbI with pentapeptide repeats